MAFDRICCKKAKKKQKNKYFYIDGIVEVEITLTRVDTIYFEKIPPYL